MAGRILIKNASVVNEGRTFVGSVLICGDRIEKVHEGRIGDESLFLRQQGADGCADSGRTAGRSGGNPCESGQSGYCMHDAVKVIDGDGMLLIPGVIDDQVHFREPGNTHKGDIFSESRAAVAGGVTTFMEMPNTNPPTCSKEELDRKYEIAAARSHANYSFYIGASNTNMEEILSIDPSEYCGIKVFMGSSTGNMLVDDMSVLEGLFKNSRKVIATHCEDESIIRANMAAAKEKYGENIPFSMHPVIRSRQACIKSTEKAVSLALKYGTPLHVLHISTEDEIGIIRSASEENPLISGEICVHYLYFNDTMYEKYGPMIKCNPAIKKESDMLALRKAVKDGTIRVVATDHAPHLLSEKRNPYLSAPSGLPLVQHSLLMMMELARQGVFDVETVVDRMCHGPALRFGIKGRGFIREGYYADLAMLRPVSGYKPEIMYKCGWSPVCCMEFGYKVENVFVNGSPAVLSGVLNEDIRGMRVEFGQE